jgi:hypothetical protein
MPACGSPKLIAACHVLLRLLLPRHPPCALSSLTTKFTRHTATSRSPGNSPLRSPVIFVIPSEARNLLSFRPARSRPCHHTPLKLYGPLLLLIAHTRLLNAMRTSSFSQALIKIYNALYFAQSIQLSNIVLISLLFYSQTDLPRICGYGSCSVRGVQTPYRLQPNVRRQTTFIEP